METLLNNFIQAMGWSILHSLWQGALIFGLLILTRLKGIGLSSTVRYNLAYVANCLIFASFILTFISVFQWNPVTYTGIPQGDIGAIPLTVILAQYVERLFPYLVFLYGSGLIFQSFLVFRGYRIVQLLKKADHLRVPTEWNLLFEALKDKLQLKKTISFHLSEHVRVPLVIGYLKPVILFPVALAAQLDINQTEAILIHELAHIRRNDYLFNLVKTMIDTLLFFNPFIWLTGKFIDTEREHVCDDLVVNLTNTPLTYAHALLKLEILVDKSSPVLAMGATGKSQDLYQRIKRITNMKTNYMNPKQKLFTVMVTVATVFSLAWINPVKNEQHPKKPVVKNIEETPSLTLDTDTGKKKKTVIAKKKKSDEMITGEVIGGTPVPAQAGMIQASVIYPAPPPPPMIQGSVIYPAQPSSPMIQGSVIYPAQPTLNNTIQVVPANDPDGSFMPTTQPRIFVNPAMTVDAVPAIQLSVMDEARINLQQEVDKLQRESDPAIQRKRIKAIQQQALKIAKQAQAQINTPEFRRKMAADIQYAQTVTPRIYPVVEGQPAQTLSSRIYTLSDGQYAPVTPTLSARVYPLNDAQLKVMQSPEYIELKKKFDKDVAALANKKAETEK